MGYKMFKRIHVYDLDGVLVDSSHRYRNLANGTIDLKYWLANRTPENINRDKLLPHVWQYVNDILNPYVYVILCTSRTDSLLDREFIRNKLGQPNKLFMRASDPIDYSPDSVMKRRALQTIFNLKQFQYLPRTLWEDNRINIDRLGDLFTHTIYVPSQQGA